MHLSTSKSKVIYAIKNDNVNDFRLIYDISDCKIKEIIIFQDFKKIMLNFKQLNPILNSLLYLSVSIKNNFVHN